MAKNRDARIRSEREKIANARKKRMEKPTGISMYAKKRRAQESGAYVPPQKREDPTPAIVTFVPRERIYRGYW